MKYITNKQRKVLTMRLLDRILSESYISNDPKINHSRVNQNLGKAQLVVVDNVAAYCTTELETRGNKGLDASDFPNVMLPFNLAFFDMRLPSSLTMSEAFEAGGVLMEMFEAHEFRRFMDFENIKRSMAAQFDSNPFFSEQVSYYLTCFLFLRQRHFRENVHFANFCVPVNKEGQILPSGANIPWVGAIHQDVPGFEGTEAKKTILGILFERFLYPAFLSISFMHCRNVKVTEEKPPEKLSKKHKKKTGKSLLKYRVLHIDHMRQVLEHEGGASKTGLKAALHICRGHFKHYGKDGSGLLFGKHAATIWVPMHTRGTKDEGVVVKDYDVK
jgi:hypothetical protein